jgi:hypothetical protein
MISPKLVNQFVSSCGNLYFKLTQVKIAMYQNSVGSRQLLCAEDLSNACVIFTLNCTLFTGYLSPDSMHCKMKWENDYEFWIRKADKGSPHSLFQDIILTFTSKNWEIPWKIWAMTDGALARQMLWHCLHILMILLLALQNLYLHFRFCCVYIHEL